jgi:hypothetical protein
MKSISTFRLAIWSGVFAEVVFCCILVFTDLFSNHAGIYTPVAMLHEPGLWLAVHLGPMRYILALPLAILSGMASFGIICWTSISVWRAFRKKHTSA